MWYCRYDLNYNIKLYVIGLIDNGNGEKWRRKKMFVGEGWQIFLNAFIEAWWVWVSYQDGCQVGILKQFLRFSLKN